VENALGEDLVALYRYASWGQAESRLLAVVADKSTLHKLRETFLPVWLEEQAALGEPPLVAPITAFNRHVHLFPLFAEQLAHQGELVSGTDLLQAGTFEQTDGAERAAYFAHQALLASGALAPELLPDQEAQRAQASLYRLARHLCEEPPADSATAAVLFCQVQAALRELIEGLPGRPLAEFSQPVLSAEEPNLQAIYEETDHTVVILPELSEDLLRQIDWGRLAERLREKQSSLRVTTVPQLRLLLQAEAPLDFVLGRYEHRWGPDPLAALQVSTWAVWRNAGRLPSRLLVDEVPAAYLTAADSEAIHKVIHDYQNRLLNMRLRHELLSRLHSFEAAVPPVSLPGREAALPLRIDAILAQLHWWADYYFRQMEQTAPGAKLAAP
jgi:hypothetical protein